MLHIGKHNYTNFGKMLALSLMLFFVSSWPAFHQSTVHSSPLLYDIDTEGVREIALATYNGVKCFSSGSLLLFLYEWLLIVVLCLLFS